MLTGSRAPAYFSRSLNSSRSAFHPDPPFPCNKPDERSEDFAAAEYDAADPA